MIKTADFGQIEDTERIQPPTPAWYTKWRPTVEPTMFLYMMAFMITSVMEQAFFVNKACRVNHGYSEDICDSLEKHNDIKTEVQKTVSSFHQWNNILGHIVPIILALFLGSWSDRRGRKLPLIMGLCGKLIYSVMIIVNSYQPTWPVEYVIYTATIPSAMTGADVAIFASCFTYITDITSSEHRTMRITVLDVIYLSTMPTGVAIGSALFYNSFNKSFGMMFVVNASCLFLAIVYTFIALKWQTTDQQRPITELKPYEMVLDFFDKKHVIASVRTLTKKRPDYHRLYLWIFMIAMALYTFQRDEKPMLYLYTQLKFDWDAAIYSNFKVFQSSAFVILMLVSIPFMSRVLHFRDTTIIMVGATAHASARLFFGFATSTVVFYVGGAISSLGPIVAPVLRSMTSKSVAQEERGKVFALLSVFDNAIPIFSGVLYSQIYIATVDTHPASIFWLTLGTQVSVFLLIMIIHVTLGTNSIDVQEQKDAVLISSEDAAAANCTTVATIQPKDSQLK